MIGYTTERDAVVVPALREEPEGVEPPEHLEPWCFRSASWWRRHWTRSGAVEVAAADR